jgi:phosphotriesterase-related protein
MPDGVARAVAGPVAAAELGGVLMHEHVVGLVPGRYLSAGTRPDERDLAVRALAPLAAWGYRTVVTLTGRAAVGDPAALAGLQEVARRSGLTVVAGFGFYTQRWFPPGVADLSIDDLTRRFVDAATEIDGSGVPAGIYGEIATSLDTITEGERRCLIAAARAQTVTGLPIYTHATLGTMAEEQVEILLSAGALPELVVIGHQDLRPDRDVLAALLSAGVTVAFDTIGKESFDLVSTVPSTVAAEPPVITKRVCHRPDAGRLAALRWLVDNGWAGQVVLSMDLSGSEAFTNPTTHGAYGYGYLPAVFLPRLVEAGVSPEAIDTMTVRNPARLLAGSTAG